jgi:hypothetical protein
MIAARCDSSFWLIKEAKKVVYGWKHRKQKIMKKGGFGQNQDKMSIIFCFWMERFLFWPIKEAKKAIDGWKIDQKCDSFLG